jgi:hypothetical protein
MTQFTVILKKKRKAGLHHHSLCVSVYSMRVISNNPEGSMRQVLDTFIKGSRKGK